MDLPTLFQPKLGTLVALTAGSGRLQAPGLGVCGGLGQEGLGDTHSKENHPLQYFEERLCKASTPRSLPSPF